MKLRSWKVGDELHSYGRSDPFLSFLNKFATNVVGTRVLGSWIKDHPSKTLLDKLITCSMTYAVLIYENTKDLWVENEDIKKEYMAKDQRKNAPRIKVPKYQVKNGTKLPLYADGLTDEGRLYFKAPNEEFLMLKNNGTF